MPPNFALSLRHQLLVGTIRHLDRHQVRILLNPDCAIREPCPSPSVHLGSPSPSRCNIGSSSLRRKPCTNAFVRPASLRVSKPYSLRATSLDLTPNSDYRGLLPLLSGIPNMLDVPLTTTLTPSLSGSLSSLDEEEASGASPSLTHARGDNTAARSTRRKFASLAHVSPRSQYNPFYGYPIGPPPYSLTPASLPYLQHGRRRKRDLIRTLATLWWEKWRSRVSWTVSFLFVFFCVRWWWRQRRNSMFLIRDKPH